MSRGRPQRAALDAAAIMCLTLAFMGVSAAEPAASSGSKGMPDLPPLESLSATLERPLFVRGRRPPTVAAEPVVEAAPVIVDSDEAPAELTGIVMGPARAAALLKSRAAEETVLLERGGAIDGWSVEEIGARHVVLRRGMASVRLVLFEQKEGDQERPARPQFRPASTQRRAVEGRRGTNIRRSNQRPANDRGTQP